MANIKLYTMDHCPYCIRAKALLGERGISYEEIKLTENDDAEWAALAKKTGMQTVPQIFNGDDLIGGYTDLAALDQKTGLKDLR